MKPTAITYDEGKLKELTLYIATRCAVDEHYGVLKLNKVLFYSDFIAFKTLGKPITGAEYRKYTHGPAPARMKPLKLQMIADKDAMEWENPAKGLQEDGSPYVEKRLFPLRPADLTLLTSEEIAIVDGVIEWLRPKTGHRVSLMSHKHPGWHYSEMEKAIPYFSAFLPEVEKHPEALHLSKRDMKRAQEVASKYSAGQIAA